VVFFIVSVKTQVFKLRPALAVPDNSIFLQVNTPFFSVKLPASIVRAYPNNPEQRNVIIAQTK
jgi:hypothetical protein